MSLCPDCIKGVKHEGTPTGKWEDIGGVPCYVAVPAGDYPKDKIVLYLCDGFGPQLINNQLLVDDFANNGFRTVALDYFNGDPVPADYLDHPDGTFSISEWLKSHGPDVTHRVLYKVVGALIEQGVKRFGATGYCFGGRYVFNLALQHDIHVAVVSHPSFLKSPDDFNAYATKSKAPLLINSCTIDEGFPHEAQAQADEILGNGKFSPGYKRNYFEGCTHGFAVRGDLSDPKVKAGKEGSFVAAVEWFKAYL